MSSAKQTSNESISLVDTLLRWKELRKRVTDFQTGYDTYMISYFCRFTQ